MKKNLKKLWVECQLRQNPSLPAIKGLGKWMQLNYGIQRWILNNVPCCKFNLEDAFDADTTFEQLMGDEVEPRRKFIEENAMYVKNIDT